MMTSYGRRALHDWQSSSSRWMHDYNPASGRTGRNVISLTSSQRNPAPGRIATMLLRVEFGRFA
jgi:hypothetical protein